MREEGRQTERQTTRPLVRKKETYNGEKSHHESLLRMSRSSASFSISIEEKKGTIEPISSSESHVLGETGETNKKLVVTFVQCNL